MSSLSAVVKRAMRTRTWRRMAPVLWAVTLVACSGQSCTGCGGAGIAPIPGGFKVSERKENAIQLRLAKGLFDFISSNLALIKQYLPGGGMVAIPKQCGGNPELWCGSSCGAAGDCHLSIDPTGLTFTPQPAASAMGVTLRTKIKTLETARVHYKTGIISVTCDLKFDTARSGKADVGLVLNLLASVDAQTRLANLNIDQNSVDIQDLDSNDIDIGGSFGCDILDFFKGAFIGTIKDAIKGQIAAPLNDLFCQSCKTSADCSSLATMGCDAGKKQCMRAGKCMQFLGTEGRLDLGALLGGISPTAAGSGLQIYAAAGGYANVESVGGISMGMLGGALADPASDCVPLRPAPTAKPAGKAPGFAGNTAPNGQAYHVGAGISTVELDTLGHGFYQSGGLCLAVGTPQVALLSSSTLSALINSLGDLTRGQNASVYVVLRPQNPPVFTLGKGTFKTGANGQKTIDDPLMTLGMKDFSIDFYLYMDERYTRVMRLTSDLAVPLSLDVDNKNQIVPMLGDLAQGLKNVRVTDTALLRETPAQLSALFPKLLPVLLGQVAGSLKPIALPNIMGLALSPVQITSVPDATSALTLLGLYLKIAPAMLKADPQTSLVSLPPEEVIPAETRAELIRLDVPPAAQFRLGPQHDPLHGPRAVLRVDGQGAGGAAEWQYAVDDGLWRPFDDVRELVVDDPVLGLPGQHHIDVRARVVGQPQTLDPTPARVTFSVMPLSDSTVGAAFHGGGGPEPGGCGSCNVQRGTPSPLSGLAVLLLGGLLWRRRARAGLLALAGVAAGTAACSDGTTAPMGGPGNTFAKEDEIGRYQSALVRDGAIYISAYNTTFGDLAFAKVTDPNAEISWQVVDGVPDGTPDVTTKDAPRRGFTDPGPDVGKFTSLSFKGGAPLIAYQDVSGGRLRLATGSMDKWDISSVDEPPAGSKVSLGAFASLAIGDGDVPSVAYMSIGAPLSKGPAGALGAQLIVATATSASPAGPADWNKTVVDEARISCGGLCGVGQACTYADPTKKDAATVLCKPLGGTCATPCAKGTACVGGACVDALDAGPAELPPGTGLFARLLKGPSGLRVVYYNRATRSLMTAAAPEWKAAVVDGGTVDVGQHIGAAYGDDGTLHIAYQDAVKDRLVYRTYSAAGKAGALEVADDGSRGAGDARELHSVGAGAALFLDSGTVRVAYQDQTAVSLELASKPAGGTFTHETRAPGGDKGRGFYPQAVQLGGKWIVLDVNYDRMRDPPLSAVSFTTLQ